jgi:hypothetical protein
MGAWMAEPVARFAGTVTCARGAGALGLTLSGTSLHPPGQPLAVGFASGAPAGLPAVLEDAVIAEPSPGTFRIASEAGSWTLSAPVAHVHREVGVAFYGAIPPRPVPPGKRVFWRLVLTLAGSRTGMALLRALRGRA